RVFSDLAYLASLTSSPSFVSYFLCFFFSSRRRHTRCYRDWSSDVCSSDLAQLLRSRDHTPLWAESYERNAADVLAIQREVASRIAQALELELFPASPATRTPVNSGAHEAYLKGRYYWNKRTVDGVKKGIECFQQAMQKDPKYAPAYVGLADSYLVLSSWMRIPSKEAAAKAREAATRA